MKEQVSIYRQHITHPQCQELAVEEYLRTCGGRKFYVFFFQDLSR